MNIGSTVWVKQATPPLSSAKSTVVPPTAGLLIRSYSNFLPIDSGPCKAARCIPQRYVAATRAGEEATLL